MSKLFLALDVPNVRAAEALAKQLVSDVDGFKVGGELFLAEGPAICDLLVGLGVGLFVDLKLHDIPRTVEAGAKRLAKLGAEILTVHALGGSDMVKAAVQGASVNAKTKVVAVTVLTSHNDLGELGINEAIDVYARRLATVAMQAGAHGLVCSVHEAQMLRVAHRDALIVCPGIRLPGQAAHDQKRAATPGEAKRAGADVLVLGRAVLDATDKKAALWAVRRDE